MTPVLLVMGIIAQAILLIIAVLLFVPCLIWPELLDPPYRWVVRGMGRIMARSITGGGKRRAAVVISPPR